MQFDHNYYCDHASSKGCKASMISVETLLNLVSIVEQGSFSSAAEILNQTPSAVSRALSRLEGQLSVLIDLRLSKGYLYWISGVQPLNNINQQPT